MIVWEMLSKICDEDQVSSLMCWVESGIVWVLVKQ